jgi:hypothetical protein
VNLLELFAGSRSVGKVAEAMGWNVFSSDIEAYPDIDYVIDILDFDLSKVSLLPDVIWASPDCTTYSIAAGSHHREYMGTIPMAKTQAAILGDSLVLKTLEIIKAFPDAKFFIENPVGLLRKMPFMRKNNMIRQTVTYCQYGDTRMKPTDIFTNSEDWQPRPICKNGDPCHEAAPRGSRTGTQGLKGSYERSKIPEALCREILLSIMEKK